MPIESIMATIAKSRSDKEVDRGFFGITGLPVGLLSLNLIDVLQEIESPIITELLSAVDRLEQDVVSVAINDMARCWCALAQLMRDCGRQVDRRRFDGGNEGIRFTQSPAIAG